MTVPRKIMLPGLAAVVTVALMELASATIIWASADRLDHTIRRTPSIYAAQSAGIRRLFFSDTLRGIIIDSMLGWTIRPTFSDQSSVHNSAGLRTAKEYAPVAGPGVLRVSAFGDSFVYGSEVDWDEAWPALIEAADTTIELLNYGVGGYGLDQAFLRFQREGRTMSPSVVIMGFTTDDLRRLVNVYRRFISPNELPQFKPRFEFDDDQRLRLIPAPVRTLDEYQELLDTPDRVREFGQNDYWYQPLVYQNPFHDWSATVRLVSAAWVRVGNRLLFRDRIFKGESFNTESEAFRLQVAIFQAFHDSVRAAGAAPLVVFLPDQPAVEARARGMSPAYAPLAHQLDALGIQYLDVADAFVEKLGGGPVHEWFMPYGHYSPDANRIVAEWLAPRIRKPASPSS